MSEQPLVIVGAGGFGREVYWLIEEINQVRPSWRILGFIDDNPQALAGFAIPKPILGSLDDYHAWHETTAVCAIGDPSVRKAVVARASAFGVRWATLVHPTAFIGSASTIGEGSILCRGAGITVNVRLGSHVHMNLHATAGHDSRLGNFCTLSGHVDVCGAATVEEGVFLGSHAVVLPKATVGEWARVGAGSVVLRRANPYKTVFGVPAKEVL